MKFFIYASLVGFAIAAPGKHWTRDVTVFESINAADLGWKLSSAPHPDQAIDLKIALKESGDIYSHLYEISDPSHARYGQHLSVDEVHGLTAASQHTQDLVREWLASHGIQSARLTGSWVTVRVPVSLAEQILNTNYGIYENAAGDKVLRTEGYSLPHVLRDHVDVVAPTTYFGGMRRSANTLAGQGNGLGYGIPAPPFPVEQQQTAYGGVCDSRNVTAACLATHYGFSNYTAKAADKNSFGITGFLGEHLNFVDLDLFLKKFVPSKAGYNYTVQLVNGGNNNQSFAGEGEGEAALDVQEAAGIAAPARGFFWSTAGIPPIWPDDLVTNALNNAGAGNEPYLEWLEYLATQKEVPYVISTSYDDDEQSVPFPYATRVCNEFAKLGARGVSLLFSAGDFGPGGTQPTNCTANDGSNKHKFLANFPSSCPAVTAVGGTSGFSPEFVTTFPGDGGSGGGGFSEYFSRPSYQDAAVKGYLAKINNTNGGWFNPNGRAFPDISFNGRNFSIFFNAKNVRISGTSASAPGLAGFLTLVNDARLAAGKGPLGFLNPLLYSGKLAGAFRDTTVGSNPAWSPGCNFTLGFPATEGWDAATGWGSPMFQPMVQAVLALP